MNRVLCDARASMCRCYKDAGHVEAGDPVHECDERQCTGAWIGPPGFMVVRWPFPVPGGHG